MNKDLKARLNKIDEIREELKKAEKSATKDIMGMLKDLMKENPKLVALMWQQYIPGFNDGEPCEFSINGPHFKFSDDIVGVETKKSEDDEDYDSEEEYLDEYGLDDFLEKRADILNHKEITSLKRAVKDATAVYNKLTDMEAQLQSMFGTNVQIVVTKDGVETEDYDCGH